MDFYAAQPVIDALQSVVDNKVYGYSVHYTEPRYFGAIMHWFKVRRNWDIKPEEIIYVPGTMEAVKLAILAFSKPGDGVLIHRPGYGPFTDSINITGRKIINSQLINTDGYYTIDFEDLEKKAKDPNVTLYILCNPHNPTGRIFKDDELKKIAQICRENNITILADEIHSDIIRKGQEFHPLATVTDYKNIVTFTSISKAFNLGGLRCTNVIIQNDELRNKFMSIVGIIFPSPFAIAGLIAAYTEGEDWLTQVNDYIDSNIDWAIMFMKERLPKVKCHKPEGSYILWLDFRGYGLSGEEVNNKICNNANVILESGPLFDPDQGAGFMRMCVPSPRPLLKEAFERIAKEFEG